MMKTVMILVVVSAATVQGTITNVTGWNSSAEEAPAIMGAPAHLLDDTTFELGHALKAYTVTFPGSGKAAPFNARGLERNAGGNGKRDGYLILDPHTLRMDMRVTETGDWMRVVTAPPVPAPGALLLTGLGTCFIGTMRYRRSL